MEQYTGVQQSLSEERPWKDIIADVVHDIENIFRNELRLAAIELKTKFQKSAKAGSLLAAAGILGFFALACFLGACVVALAIVVPWWFAFVLMGILLAIAAGGAFMVGRLALHEIDPIPQRTVETMQDNIEWVKTHATP